ncbi:MAG: hypothetical protein IT442_03795 [Phycisphaeraceae bacterium]|nr:hypothetical protein [Phycisphaeraceae bacterium]
MSSWSCPHLDERTEFCRRLGTDCVPGRPGCVLPSNLVFAVPLEERLRAVKKKIDRHSPAAAQTPPLPRKDQLGEHDAPP